MPGHTHLTDLEQLLLLAVLRFENEAYGASLQADIEDVADRHVSLGSIHMTLGRLEERGPGPLGEVGSAAQPRRQGSTYLPGHREGPGGTRVEPPRDRPDVGWRAGGRPAVNPLPLGLGGAPSSATPTRIRGPCRHRARGAICGPPSNRPHQRGTLARPGGRDDTWPCSPFSPEPRPWRPAVAAWLPARRAAVVDPARVLNEQG